MLGALGRLSPQPGAQRASRRFYVSLVRGTPLLLQILFIYLALPQSPDRERAPQEVLRHLRARVQLRRLHDRDLPGRHPGGPRGQTEAAAVAGHAAAGPDFVRIISPQAFRIVTPAIGNEFISMIKDSSLVSVIGVPGDPVAAQRVGQSNFQSLRR